MAGRKTQKGGKAQRKYGRTLRSPSHLRYNLYHRREQNKLRRMAKRYGRDVKVVQDYARLHHLTV